MLATRHSDGGVSEFTTKHVRELLEDPDAAWDGELALWLVASRLPLALRARCSVRELGPGCYEIDSGGFPFVWIAANDLPLCDELIPFLIARTGRALDEFVLWVQAEKKAPIGRARVVECSPMSTAGSKPSKPQMRRAPSDGSESPGRASATNGRADEASPQIPNDKIGPLFDWALGRAPSSEPLRAPSALRRSAPIDHLTVRRTALSIVVGDIVRAGTVAIVNAANTDLMGGGGVDGAIHRAAGYELYNLTRRFGGCPVGEAVITGACRIPPPTRFIIHAVGPVYEFESEPECAELLTSAYRASLALVEENAITSVAFPAISAGIYGYPIDEAAELAFDAVRAHLEATPDTHLERVVFTVFSEDDRDVYRNVFSAFAER